MYIRKAILEDVSGILEVYDYAKNYMREQGNVHQWQGGYPSRSLIEDDIKRGNCYVVIVEDHDEVKKDKVACPGDLALVFYCAIEEEERYKKISNGSWLNDDVCALIRRFASSGIIKGAGAFALNQVYERIGNVKIDTHEDNKPMRQLMAKLDFVYCGEIMSTDGTPRLAFQKI